MQYDSPVTSSAFSTFLDSAALSTTTAATISSLLSLDSSTNVNLASWDGVNVEVPTGQTAATDVVVANIAGAAGDLVNLNVPASLDSAKVFVLQSDANLVVNFDAPVAAAATETAFVARFAVLADATTTTDFGLVVTTGNGNDVITVNGDQNTYVDGGNGDDTITLTGSGNNTVVAGAGNNNVTTGAGDDTIILSGTNHSDIVHAGAGYDVVQLDGTSTDYTFTVANNYTVDLGAASADVGQAAAITDAEFLSFADGSTVALAHSDAEASALRLYEGILGRDADLQGAKAFTSLVDSGTSLTDIADQFLNSAEFGGANTTTHINDLYTSLLGRDADTAGSDSWVAVLANGGTLADVAGGIAVSAEAQALDQSNGTFVNELYTSVLGRDADEAGLDAWVSQLFNGTSRAEVAAGIVGSVEAASKSDSDFIDGLYLTATGREADAAGKAAWTEVLTNGGTHADVAIGIVGSAEAIAHNDNVVVLHGAV